MMNPGTSVDGLLNQDGCRSGFNPDCPLEKLGAKKPFVVSLSNHEWPFDKLVKQLSIRLSWQKTPAKSLVIRANGFGANELFGFLISATKLSCSLKRAVIARSEATWQSSLLKGLYV